MKIRFEKEIKLTGETWYRIWADSECLKSFLDGNGNDEKIMNAAKAFYIEVIERAKTDTYPRKETIEETTINE